MTSAKYLSLLYYSLYFDAEDSTTAFPTANNRSITIVLWNSEEKEVAYSYREEK